MAFFPRLHQILGYLAPAERAGVVGVVMGDTTLDHCNALVQLVKYRIFQPLPREFGEKLFDRVHPRGRGRGEVNCAVGTVSEPLAHLGRLL